MAGILLFQGVSQGPSSRHLCGMLQCYKTFMFIYDRLNEKKNN